MYFVSFNVSLTTNLSGCCYEIILISVLMTISTHIYLFSRLNVALHTEYRLVQPEEHELVE